MPKDNLAWVINFHSMKMEFLVNRKTSQFVNVIPTSWIFIELIFVLVNARTGKHFIYHFHIYQGKNTANVHVVEEAWMLHMMQKAVANALISHGIVNDPDGMRAIYIDNCYLATELFVMLREIYDTCLWDCLSKLERMGHKSHEGVKIVTLRNIHSKV